MPRGIRKLEIVLPGEVDAYRRARGKYFQARRKEKGLTQTELGDQFGERQQSYIAKVEAGVCDVSTQRYLTFIRLLKIDEHDLVDFIQGEMANLASLNDKKKPINEKIKDVKKLLDLPDGTTNEEVIVELAKKVLGYKE